MKPKIILYYQTFCGLDKILNTNSSRNITHIHLSSIHFGKDSNNKKYIHLNDNEPYDKVFNKVWLDLEKANNLGIKIILMIGGAGGAFTDLFSDFEFYYNLLYNLLKNKKIIKGIDLDIEENVNLDNIKMLINRITKDFGENFIISLAPIQSSLEYDSPGLGGFIYKNLLNSPEGKYINYFNGQFYSDYSLDSYNKVINNNYNSEMVVMGMLGGDKTEMEKNYNEIKKVYQKYGSKFGGVFLWEYYMYPEFVNDMLKII